MNMEPTDIHHGCAPFIQALSYLGAVGTHPPGSHISNHGTNMERGEFLSRPLAYYPNGSWQRLYQPLHIRDLYDSSYSQADGGVFSPCRIGALPTDLGTTVLGHSVSCDGISL